ncbi:MAG: DciA family protein [Patescibacteria group bacterium]|nr:DciA family protein [Patescibacteria group bacterium]
MDSLFEILKAKSAASPMIRSVNAAMIVEKANDSLREFFSDDIKKYARAIYCKDCVLAIACLSSVVAQEIKLNELMIVALINKKISPEKVKKIKYMS